MTETTQPPTTTILQTLNQTSQTNLLRTTLTDRIIGSLLASALGDAIGLYTEFFTSVKARSHYPTAKFTLHPTPTPFYPDKHRCVHEYGEWTDDTDHSLLIFLSFLHSGIPPTQEDLAKRLKVWVSNGLLALNSPPLGLGRLVGDVVRTRDYEENPEGVARRVWEKMGKDAAPNGAVMRTHPLGLMMVFQGEEETFEVAKRIACVTHVDARCVISCVIVTGLVRSCVRGEVLREKDVDELIGRAKTWFGSEEIKDWEDLDRHLNPADGLDGLKLDENGIGYTYKALGCGVVCLKMAIRRLEQAKGGVLVEKEKIFEELITDLTMRAGDADTNACVAGGILGAFLGYAALPGHWKYGLKHGDWLMKKAGDFCVALGVMDGTYTPGEDPDTAIYGGKAPLTKDEDEMRWAVLSGATQTRITKLQAERDAEAVVEKPKMREMISGMLKMKF
ncbi:ADP-ribosylglycohydrolase-domain-containing protein [Podospora fimiseda]|uniref:ADP-ribosylglycohydrolase-domain-containing protein n=1 Tax=Podospora fimiseda TaxID=252190 RepID=A0AAN6YSA9_9PEZI|nr:ADP-ribosylglycohydrolase-domain-containing protein [Podospora fimiseda]